MKSTLVVNMKKIITLLCFLFGAASYAQINISGCIENLPDSISSVKIAYLKGNGLAVKQDFQIIKGCFSAPWENKERGIFIVYLDPQHSFDVVISDANLNVLDTKQRFFEQSFWDGGCINFNEWLTYSLAILMK